ncbi:MAG TPA: serine hydrolase [Candidatus Saccharimonadales bacterium]
MGRHAFSLLACIVVTTAGTVGLNIWQNHTARTISYASGRVASPAATTTKQTAKPMTSQALADIQTIIANNSNLDMSVSLTDLASGKSYTYGDTASFNAASIIKLITAVTYLHLVEQGQASLYDDMGGVTVQSQLQSMIVDSDNDAWANLEGAVTLQAQQSFAELLGLSSYDASSNAITSSDTALLLAKLWQGKVLNTVHTQQLLSWMEQANYRDFIVTAVPSSVTVYHKVGILDDRLHDAAIIKKGNHAYVLVIFSRDTSGLYDYSQGSAMFGDITKDSLRAVYTR